MINGGFVFDLKMESLITLKLPITIRGVMKKKQEPVHPGEILNEEFLKPLGLSQYRLAKGIHVPARRINEIILQKRSISADTALRLSRYFGNSPQFWMNLQAQYDLDCANQELGHNLESQIKPYAKVA